MDRSETKTAKQILESTFPNTIAKTSQILHKTKVLKAVQVTTVTPVDSELINKLTRELYENKLILDYRFSRSGYGLTIALFNHIEVLEKSNS